MDQNNQIELNPISILMLSIYLLSKKSWIHVHLIKPECEFPEQHWPHYFFLLALNAITRRHTSTEEKWEVNPVGPEVDRRVIRWSGCQTLKPLTIKGENEMCSERAIILWFNLFFIFQFICMSEPRWLKLN